MDGLRSFSQRVGHVSSLASARRVVAWPKAFGIFESQTWEVWEI